MTLRPAVFLDRDGVLNEIVERDGQPASPRSLAEFRPVPDLLSVRRLKQAGLLVFVVTNQPDIARGLVGADVVESMFDVLRRELPVDECRVCPHQDRDGCVCRKPLPGMLTDLAQHWRVDLGRSFMVGDMWRDVDAAKAAGCTPVLIRRPYNRDVEAAAEAATLAEAVDLVLDMVWAKH